VRAFISPLETENFISFCFKVPCFNAPYQINNVKLYIQYDIKNLHATNRGSAIIEAKSATYNVGSNEDINIGAGV